MEAALTQKLEQTFREEQSSLLAFVKSRISSAEDAEDILQEVFLQAARAYDVTEPIENLVGWLFRVARNRIVDWYRKKRCRTVPLSGSDEDVSMEELLGDSGINIENDYIRTLAADADDFWSARNYLLARMGIGSTRPHPLQGGAPSIRSRPR